MDYLAPLGPVYQAGTLSGNPLAMAAGIAAITILKEESPYANLMEATETLVNALTEAATQKGLPLQVPYTTSMFCLFFAEEPVRDADAACASNTEHFKKIFHYALENGVYLPPSPFETCFISTAHSKSMIEQTAEVLTNAIQNI